MKIFMNSECREQQEWASRKDGDVAVAPFVHLKRGIEMAGLALFLGRRSISTVAPWGKVARRGF